MSRTDDILDKTKRKEPEAKKWEVIVGIVVGLVLACGFFGLIFWFADVDEYLQQNKEIINLYDFYDEKHGENTTAIYFIGSSIVAESIYPPLINEILAQNGYSNVTVYSAFLSGDTPITRSVQIQNIINSKPSFVIYGLMPRDIGANNWRDEYFSLVSSRLNVREDSLYLYTPEQLASFDFDLNFFENKKYLLSALESKYVLKPHSTLDYSNDPLGIDYRKYISDTKNDVIISKNVNDSESRYRIESEISEKWTQNKEAFSYIISTLQKEGISVVAVNMPINPLLSEKISSDSYKNYYSLLNETEVTWYDLDGSISSDYFFDEVHMTFDGALAFAPIMADFIIQEMS